MGNRFRWMADIFSSGKTIAEAIVAFVVVISMFVGSWFWFDTRWDQRAIAGEAQQLQGRVNYQVNELKLGQAKQNLETWQQRWLDFQLKSSEDRSSVMGRQYMQVINGKIGEYQKQVEFYERALQLDKQR